MFFFFFFFFPKCRLTCQIQLYLSIGMKNVILAFLLILLLVGEKAGRPSMSLAKRDGRSGYSLMKEHRRTRTGGAGGVGGQMRRNVEV